MDARDPWTYAFVTATLVAAPSLATWRPALRAGRIDPVDALKSE